MENSSEIIKGQLDLNSYCDELRDLTKALKKTNTLQGINSISHQVDLVCEDIKKIKVEEDIDERQELNYGDYDKQI